jgi:natural product biosynthesis luciferase-like monooxygenase protein
MKQSASDIIVLSQENIMTRDILSKKCALLNRSISDRGLYAGAKVAVCLNEASNLMPAIVALLQHKLSVIFIEPGIDSDGIDKLTGNIGAELIILETSNFYYGATPCIRLPEELDGQSTDVSQSFNTQLNNEQASYTFFIARNDYREPIIVDALDAAAYFKELNKLLRWLNKSAMLISRDVAYEQLIMELWWALQAGVPVAIEYIGRNFQIERYNGSGEDRSMDFSLFYFGSYVRSSEKDKYRLLLETVRFADEHDFTAVWTPERHFNEFGGLYPNPSLLSAALAVVTSKVKIRSGSLVSPLHHTVRVAEDWSVVDNLSNGRVAISFASGWQCDDFIFFPDNFQQRYPHMMNQIRDIQSLWRGEKLTFKNGLGADTEIELFPKPIQKQLPVWITVSGRKESYIDAGKIGANILTHMLWQDLPTIAERIAVYRQSLQENGFPPESGVVTVMVHTFLGKDSEAVRNKVERPLKNYLRTSTELIQLMLKGKSGGSKAEESHSDDMPEELMNELVDLAFERFYERGGLLGTIEEASDLMKQFLNYGVNEVACLVDFGLEQEDIMEGLEYLNELKNLHSVQPEDSLKIGVAHFSTRALEHIKSSPQVAKFLDGQKKLLVDAEDVEKIAANLLHHVCAIRRDNTDKHLRITIGEDVLLSYRRESFTSVISNEF